MGLWKIGPESTGSSSFSLLKLRYWHSIPAYSTPFSHTHTHTPFSHKCRNHGNNFRRLKSSQRFHLLLVSRQVSMKLFRTKKTWTPFLGAPYIAKMCHTCFPKFQLVKENRVHVFENSYCQETTHAYFDGLHFW